MKERSYNGDLKGVLRQIHHIVEASERGRISQVAMACRLRISPRTYLEYLRGTHSPLAMKVMLDMLGMLNDEHIVRVVREWSSSRQSPETTNDKA